MEGKGSLAVLLLAERARSEGARSTRAIEIDQPTLLRASIKLATVLLDGLFEQPASLWPTRESSH
jgi:hypothetical protein